jgi:hypothetical protein
MRHINGREGHYVAIEPMKDGGRDLNP